MAKNVQRRLAAILAADVVGYRRLIGEAVQCAIEIQHTMAERNADVPEGRRIPYRNWVEPSGQSRVKPTTRHRESQRSANRYLLATPLGREDAP